MSEHLFHHVENVFDVFFRRNEGNVFRKNLVDQIGTVCILFVRQNVYLPHDVGGQHQAVHAFFHWFSSFPVFRLYYMQKHKFVNEFM